MENEKLNVNPISDHDEKYDVEKNILKTANDKLKNIGKSLPEGTTKKGELIVHKRTRQDYNDIWKSFLQTEEKDFFEKMGYGKRKIKHIGIKKFIDFMDWRKVDDVSKWKSDKLHAVVCVHCNKEFALFEFDDGLCQTCKKLYDTERLGQAMYAAEQQEAGSSLKIKLSFMYESDFRNMYLKKDSDIMLKEAAGNRLEGMDSYRLLKDCIRNKELRDKVEKYLMENIDKEIKVKIIPFFNLLRSGDEKDAFELLMKIYDLNN